MAPRKASESSSRSSTELIRIGRVGRPHGTDGGFTVAQPTDRTELFAPGRTVVVGDRELTVTTRRGTPAHPIVVLEGAGDRAAAAALRGEPISVPRTALGELGGDEFLVDDLVDCEVVDGDRRVGRVRDVLLLPSADALEVEVAGSDPLLVPLVADAVRKIDTAGRTIEVDMGFLTGEAG
jgi:16S rRNA processing protein RimM